MNYWLLTTEFPPFYGGGISTYCKFTAEMLASRGHAVTVFVQDFSVSDFQEDFQNTIKVVRFSPLRSTSKAFLGYEANLSYAFASIVGEYLQKEGIPDILESQEYNGIAYYLQQFKLLEYPLFEELNIVITCHAPGFLYLEYNKVPVFQFPEYWIGVMEKSSIIAADLVISPSRYLLSELKKRMPWENIQETYLVNPMNTEGASLEGVPEFVPQRIVCFGKLSPLKGTFELLSYFEELWNSGYSFQLDLVGSTQQFYHAEGRTMGDFVRKKYQGFIKKNLLRLHKEMAPQAAKEFIKKSHVVVVPSIVDNLPYTVLEAMSWGKVVLASKQGGQSEIIEHGVTGFLFGHHISGDFQNKLFHVLGLSDASIKQIGANAQQAVLKNYHPDVVYERKMAIIQNFLKQRSPRKDFPFNEPLINKEIAGTAKEEINSLLSIVIPFYNMGDFIEECVKSVCASEYPAKEIIIVDDGSTEPKSREKLEYLQKNYPVKIFSKKNEGLSATRNVGAAKATGGFLAFLDADDTVEATYFSKAINVLNKYQNVYFVGCWVQYFGNSKNIWPSFNPEPPYLLLHNMVNSSALVYKKNAFLSVGLNDTSLVYGMEDWESVISMVTKGYGGVVLPEALYNYRVRNGSMARSFNRVKKLFLHKLIAEKHSVAYQTYGTEIALLSASNGSLLNHDNPTFAVKGGGIGMSLADQFKNMFKEKVKRNARLRDLAYSIYKRLK